MDEDLKTSVDSHTALLHASAIMIAFYLSEWKAAVVVSWLGAIGQYAADSRTVPGHSGLCAGDCVDGRACGKITVNVRQP